MSAVVKWLLPILGTGALSALGLGWGWLHSRTSLDEVAPRIAEVSIAAKAAQSSGLHNETELAQVKALAVENARLQLQLWGQAEVTRAYARSPNLANYIERARRYYLAAFDDYLERNPNDPAAALRRATQLTWRPDRED